MDFIQNNQKTSCITDNMAVIYTHGQTARSATLPNQGAIWTNQVKD
nr:MAG TPA: hypothetical protein [Caudoviricetes sp.]